MQCHWLVTEAPFGEVRVDDSMTGAPAQTQETGCRGARCQVVVRGVPEKMLLLIGSEMFKKVRVHMRSCSDRDRSG